MVLDIEHSTEKIIAEDDLLNISRYSDIIIFGAGESGSYLVSVLRGHGLVPSCFCDNNKGKQGTLKDGLMVYSPIDAMNIYPNACICIGSLWAEEIKQQISIQYPLFECRVFDILLSMVWEMKNKCLISKEKSFITDNMKQLELLYNNLYDEKSRCVLENLLNYRLTRKKKYLQMALCTGEQYFDTEIIPVGEYEKEGYFIDGGAFDGDTIEKFCELFPNTKFIFHCYEPEKKNIENFMAKEQLIKSKRIIIHEAGLFSTSAIQGEVFGDSLGAVVKESEYGKLKLETIDDLSREYPLRFIKLDIEGAELSALIGGKNRIVEDRPILAICTYHLQEDLLRISEFIDSIGAYDIYLRHYMVAPSETIMYGIPKEIRNKR